MKTVEISCPGYASTADGISPETGFEKLYECEFEDMFEAFETMNRGVIGGARTVNDFTPEGLDDGPYGGEAQRSAPEKAWRRIEP